MSPESLPFNPDETVAATWRMRLVGTSGEEKTHWRTKIAYYCAVRDLVEAGSAMSLTWSQIVGRVQPHGSRSTFYEVTGPRAKRALVSAFKGTSETEGIALAYCYTRRRAVDQLVDETKVWSYWQYRRGWLDQCLSAPGCDATRAVDALFAAVGVWARSTPRLAAALDHAPPACAVEDLLMINHGRLAAGRAFEALRQTIIEATGPGGDLTDVAPDVVVDHTRSPAPPLAPGALIVRLAEQIYAVSRETRRLAEPVASAVREEAKALMNDAVWQLG